MVALRQTGRRIILAFILAFTGSETIVPCAASDCRRIMRSYRAKSKYDGLLAGLCGPRFRCRTDTLGIRATRQ